MTTRAQLFECGDVSIEAPVEISGPLVAMIASLGRLAACAALLLVAMPRSVHSRAVQARALGQRWAHRTLLAMSPWSLSYRALRFNARARVA